MQNKNIRLIRYSETKELVRFKNRLLGWASDPKLIVEIECISKGQYEELKRKDKESYRHYKRRLRKFYLKKIPFPKMSILYNKYYVES